MIVHKGGIVKRDGIEFRHLGDIAGRVIAEIHRNSANLSDGEKESLIFDVRLAAALLRSKEKSDFEYVIGTGQLLWFNDNVASSDGNCTCLYHETMIHSPEYKPCIHRVARRLLERYMELALGIKPAKKKRS